jgi:transmembrane sensor
MICMYMGKKKTNSFVGNPDEKAEAWFAQHNDDIPADVFKNTANRERIGAEIFSRVYQEIHPVRKIKLRVLQAAAAVLIMASAGLIFSNYQSQRKPNTGALTWTLYRTDQGKTRLLKLADSSFVTLHSGAELAVPSNFGSTRRTVKLKGGEAYFKIKHDHSHPFIVQSGILAVKVLGTAFNVRNILPAKQTEVSVSEGKVQVAANRQVLGLLTKGKRITYNITSGRFITDQVHLSSVAAWRSKSIELDNVSFSELSEVFSSFYGCELEAANPRILRFSYTLTIDKEKDALSTSKIIAKIHGLNLKESNGKITLQ